jgi:Tol biopolymer transport system component
MNADGSNQIRLTHNSANNEPAGDSPDGKQIAFISDQDGYRELYLMSSDGSNQKRITSLKEMISQVRWSPDGHYFGIISNLDKNYDPKNWKTWMVSLDGSVHMDLTQYTIRGVSWRP